MHKEMRGFEYLVYSAVSLCLLIILVLIPLAPAFADEVLVSVDSPQIQDIQIVEPDVLEPIESEPTTSATIVDSVPSESGVAEELLLSEEEVITLDTDTDTSIDTTTDELQPDVEDVLENEQLTVDEITETTEIDEVVEEDVASVEDTISDTSTSTDTLVDIDTEPTPEIDTTTDAIADTDDEVEEVEQENPGETITVNTVNDDTNKFSFSKDECTAVGDGTFYCAEAVETAHVTYTDRIFSASDVEGDKEVYVEKDGELIQISSNQFDDDAPYYDEVSNTAVWHRLIDGRYQIIIYDFDTETESQLTHDRYNNMQPNRFGDAIVWQGWVGSDWEIFLEEKGDVKMLTDNTTHDITPNVNGTHIVWQSFESNAWQMKVYDMRTGAIDTIENAEGGSIENPRFVLVYDTKFESGDVETKGYDLKSGEVVHLASKPVSLPEELPDPDQTGEERALVTTVTQLKPKTEGDDENASSTMSGGNDDPPTDDVIVEPFVPEVVATSTVDFSPDELEVSIPSIEIPVYDSSQQPAVEHISDVVVTPYVEEIATSTDTH